MATMYDEAGIGPTRVIHTPEQALAFQREVMETQLRLETSNLALAQNLDADKIAILCDRALIALSGFLGLPEPFEIERKFLIELRGENDTVNLPDFIKVAREVTEEHQFKNHTLAFAPPDHTL